MGARRASTSPLSFKPLQNGAVLCWLDPYEAHMGHRQSFKPLQNGAVLCWVRIADVPSGQVQVSNPFRTGRYCAVNGDVAFSVNGVSFKPLQNGAVLCCNVVRKRKREGN